MNFTVQLLEEAKEFIKQLDPKTREKVLSNILKARDSNNIELFKKLDDEIWEFRTQFNKNQIRLFAFWDKISKEETLVLATHGIIKKKWKIDKRDLNKAHKIRENYFTQSYERSKRT